MSAAAILLVGLVLNATIGWWWADPLAPSPSPSSRHGEGIEAWRGELPRDD